VPISPNLIPTLADPKARFYRNSPVQPVSFGDRSAAITEIVPNPFAQRTLPKGLATLGLVLYRSHCLFSITHFPSALPKKLRECKKDEETRTF